MPCRRKYYRDKNKYRIMIKKQKARYRKRTGSNVYERRSYTLEEDNMILERSIPDSELSVLLKRSVTAIQIRRSRLKNEI